MYPSLMGLYAFYLIYKQRAFIIYDNDVTPENMFKRILVLLLSDDVCQVLLMLQLGNKDWLLLGFGNMLKVRGKV